LKKRRWGQGGVRNAPEEKFMPARLTTLEKGKVPSEDGEHAALDHTSKKKSKKNKKKKKGKGGGTRF